MAEVGTSAIERTVRRLIDDGLRMVWLTCMMPEKETFNLHGKRKRNGTDVCGVMPVLTLLPIIWPAIGKEEGPCTCLNGWEAVSALGLNPVSIKARGKEIEKHVNHGVCKEFREAY